MEPVYLHNPTFIELDDAYRSLPKFGEILLKSSNCDQSIHDLEKIGFVAIEISDYNSEDLVCVVRAFKGKHGPCHFAGMKAKYSGAALAALDDDNHLLFTGKFQMICEKTFGVFSLPPYNNRIVCIKKSQDAVEKHSKSEEEEIGDFDSDQSYLLNLVKNLNESSVDRKVLFYPGPFKMLILQDGTMVRRGKWSSIPSSRADELIQKDGLIDLNRDQTGRSSYFQEEYERYGSACLLDDFKPEVINQRSYETDFSKFHLVSNKFKTRLLHLIDEQKKYFVLIGNEANDQLGCCPSEEVTEANHLVKHGVLSSLAETIQGDSCPVTIYAFKGEISMQGHVLSSNINHEFRRQVHIHLTKSRHSRGQQILKVVLLAFVLISLVVAMRRCFTMQQNPVETSLHEQLNPMNKRGIQLILFHNKKRCFQCLQIEKYALEVLNEVFHNELQSERIQFNTLVIDDVGNLPIVDHFGIFSATLVLIDFDQKQLRRSKVLMETTRLYRDEKAFKEQLKSEVQQFLPNEYE